MPRRCDISQCVTDFVVNRTAGFNWRCSYGGWEQNISSQSRVFLPFARCTTTSCFEELLIVGLWLATVKRFGTFAASHAPPRTSSPPMRQALQHSTVPLIRLLGERVDRLPTDALDTPPPPAGSSKGMLRTLSQRMSAGRGTPWQWQPRQVRC